LGAEGWIPGIFSGWQKSETSAQKAKLERAIPERYVSRSANNAKPLIPWHSQDAIPPTQSRRKGN